MSASGSIGIVPRVIGRYAVYDRIASGGMATVHFGRLLGPVGFARTVAIKRLHAHLMSDRAVVDMLLDEARLVARIHHPNVVPTLDMVATDDELFIVMDYVHGESLSKLVRSATAQGTHIPPDLVATLLAGALHGLHAAHEARGDHGEPLGIVHRDISPQNILVGVDGAPRVADFGVAKASGRIGATTMLGHVKGKFAYMAPEQLRTQGVGPTTDVFAASVVLWEALTGRRLFAAANDQDTIDLILAGKVEPPSVHVPGLPPALDNITMRGLNVEPMKRFPTARAMACALEDAVHFAAPSKIGEWVAASAREVLAKRAARIAAIESSSPMPDASPARVTLADATGTDESLRDTAIVDVVDAADEAITATGTPGEPSSATGSASRRRMMVGVIDTPFVAFEPVGALGTDTPFMAFPPVGPPSPHDQDTTPALLESSLHPPGEGDEAEHEAPTRVSDVVSIRPAIHTAPASPPLAPALVASAPVARPLAAALPAPLPQAEHGPRSPARHLLWAIPLVAAASLIAVFMWMRASSPATSPEATADDAAPGSATTAPPTPSAIVPTVDRPAGNLPAESQTVAPPPANVTRPGRPALGPLAPASARKPFPGGPAGNRPPAKASPGPAGDPYRTM